MSSGREVQLTPNSNIRNELKNMVQESSQFICERCLWTFEKEAEMDVHNYLEHLIMKHRRTSSSDCGLLDMSLP
jgi:hypothetical protein